MAPGTTRRDLVFAVVAATSGLALSCSKSPPATCSSSELTPDDHKLRTTLGYVDRTPDPSKPCMKCSQYLPAPAADQCGGCKLIKGPIHPQGYCNVFTPA
jgi:hypothetical protein